MTQITIETDLLRRWADGIEESIWRHTSITDAERLHAISAAIRDECEVAEKVAANCMKCDGCGRIANSEDGEPWTTWEALPPGSDLAVKFGIVKPIECPECRGVGTTEPADSSSLRQIQRIHDQALRDRDEIASRTLDTHAKYKTGDPAKKEQ